VKVRTYSRWNNYSNDKTRLSHFFLLFPLCHQLFVLGCSRDSVIGMMPTNDRQNNRIPVISRLEKSIWFHHTFVTSPTLSLLSFQSSSKWEKLSIGFPVTTMAQTIFHCQICKPVYFFEKVKTAPIEILSLEEHCQIESV
jgi:hypothetical protein